MNRLSTKEVEKLWFNTHNRSSQNAEKRQQNSREEEMDSDTASRLEQMCLESRRLQAGTESERGNDLVFIVCPDYQEHSPGEEMIWFS